MPHLAHGVIGIPLQHRAGVPARTVVASSKVTPCFFALEDAFDPSHSNR